MRRGDLRRAMNCVACRDHDRPGDWVQIAINDRIDSTPGSTAARSAMIWNAAHLMMLFSAWRSRAIESKNGSSFSGSRLPSEHEFLGDSGNFSKGSG